MKKTIIAQPRIQNPESRIALSLVLLLGFPLLSGCASNQLQRQLDAGYAQLDAQQYDQAIASARQVLDQSVEGPVTAAALYLGRRAYEDRRKLTTAAATADLQAARADYRRALDAGPDKPIEARIHAGLANVAFDLDDYGAALTEWTAACDQLDKPDDKALALFKLAKTQQRLGRWAEADQSLAAVQEQAPGSPLAQTARQLQGARGFYVRVATFATAAEADSAAAALKPTGVAVVRLPDRDHPNLQLLRAGPFTTFAQAQAVKRRVATLHPNALIEP